MTFLILSDNEIFTNVVSTKIKQLEKSPKIYKSNFQSDHIKKIKKYLSDLSLCLIYSEDTENFTNTMISETALLTGFVLAQEIPVTTNLDFLIEQNLFSSADIKQVNTKNEFITYITKKYNHILNMSNKRTAKKTLFEKGIPFTPDCFATYIAKDKWDICNLFISGGLDVNSSDSLGTPMLNTAVRNENEELVKLLLDCGADINVSSVDRGYTPLMDAVWKGNANITKTLIEMGAELNTISKEGQSNLVLAVGADKVDIVKLLAENGADPDIKDQMGMSAYGYATLFRKEKIVEILKPYHKE